MAKKKYVITSPNRRGGNFKKESELRSEYIMTRVSVDEKKQIVANATAEGLDVASFVRSRCMDTKKPQ